METKRKICEGEMEIFMEDRLSRLPEELQVRILSCLHDTKDVVQTSMLLKKRCVSLWTWIPVLDFNCFDAYNNFDVFNKFVDRVLCLRDQSAKLDRLTLTRLGARSYNILEEAFDYAFSHGVKHLEADIIGGMGPWPVPVCVDASLTRLKSVFISDLDSFSGFPMLEILTLVRCFIDIDGQSMSVHARNLLDLLTLFCTIDNVKSLTLFWSTAELLTLFPEELVNRNLTFRNLKCLKLDFRNESKGSSISTKNVADVKLYLLHNSPDVQVITINHTDLVSCDV